MLVHTCTPAAQQLLYYMHTSAVKQLHARTYMYPSCPAAPILYAHLTCQTASCLYVHVPQLPSSLHIMCTLQLSSSFMLVYIHVLSAQQLPYYMHTPAVKQPRACAYMYSSCPAVVNHYGKSHMQLQCILFSSIMAPTGPQSRHRKSPVLFLGKTMDRTITPSSQIQTVGCRG